MSSKKNMFIRHKFTTALSVIWLAIGIFTVSNVANDEVSTLGRNSSGQLEFSESALGVGYYWEAFLIIFVLPVALIWGIIWFWRRMRKSDSEKEF